jgi:hypoxanthine-guanine phosphoribosyltransferase
MEVLIAADEIRERLKVLGAEIARTYSGKPVTVVGILNGCLMFVADVIRQIDLPLRVAFITASSYRGATSAGKLEIHDELLPDVSGRHVLLLDDILDTGKTLTREVALPGTPIRECEAVTFPARSGSDLVRGGDPGPHDRNKSAPGAVSRHHRSAGNNKRSGE